MVQFYKLSTKVLELEISGSIPTIIIDPTYDQYRILIRIRNIPVGWLNISGEGKEMISPSYIKKVIQEQLGDQLIQQALTDSIPKNILKEQHHKGISVVVCTRNRTQQLTHCIESLLKQSYHNYEIIIVDNAPSTDDTMLLAKKYPIVYIREDRPGLNRARNRGIATARYDIIAFTDDDAVADFYWVETIANIFSNDQVMGASGYVAPAELNTEAQRVFELGYGGMSHGFNRRFIRKENLNAKQLLWASSFGIGANMAFRRIAFQKLGEFDTALDVGTPSKGGGDIEMFHRLVCGGFLFVYQPALLVWHYHRDQYPALYRQIFNNGCSFGCYLIDCFLKRTVNPSATIQFFIFEWLYNWNLKNLIHPTNFPRKLSLLEFYGMLTSPVAYWKTKRWNKKINRMYLS